MLVHCIETFYNYTLRVLYISEFPDRTTNKTCLDEVPLFAILTKNISQTFPVSYCQYVSTIPEKKKQLHVTDLSKMGVL